jgi:Outer membrane protein beta-barrel domain
MKQFLLIFITISCFLQATNAQTVFKGGLSLGMNAAQINGDKSAGYNKFGLQGGVQVSIETSETKYWTTGISFSGRGSRTSASEVYNAWRIKLPYIEVPLLYNIKDWKDEEKGFYRVHAGAGLAYGRLFSPKASTFSPWFGKEDYFRKNNLSWIVEATAFKNKHFGVGFRYTRDIIRIFQKSDVVNSAPLIGHFLTLKSVYIF